MGKGEWQGSLAYRWLHSDRHFIGDSEQPQRQANGSEVINDVHTFDVTATCALNPRFSLSLTLPFVTATRSSLYEHDRTNRHTMTAGGLGDVRLVGNYWLFSPEKFKEGNIGLGLGVKFPTGDYQATDVKYRRPVPSSTTWTIRFSRGMADGERCSKFRPFKRYGTIRLRI